MMAGGTCLKDLKSSIDIVATRLIAVGVSWGGGGGGGGGGGSLVTPSLIGGRLFMTSLHSTSEQTDKGRSTKRQKKSPSGGLTTH